MKRAARVGEHARRDRRADLQLAHFRLGYVREQPDLIDVANGEQLARGRAARKLPLHVDAGIDRHRHPPAADGAGQEVLLGDGIDVAGPEQPEAFQRPFLFGLGLAVVVFGRLEVAAGGRLGCEKLFLPLEVVLGRHQVGPRLHLVGDGTSHVGRDDGGERRPLANQLAVVREQPRHSPGHRREDVRDAQVVEGDAPRGDDGRGQHPRPHFGDLGLAALGGRKRGLLPGAGQRSKAGESCASSGVHGLSSFAVACSSWATASQ